jgi:hypothetical protein
MAMGDYGKADDFNNEALMVDPSYNATFVIKCQIYEDTCEYETALKMAKWYLDKCDPE